MMKIALTKGMSAKVSGEDFAILSSYNWCASQSHKTYKKGKKNKFYALRRVRENGKLKTIYMHRFIAERFLILKPGEVVDHIDGNSLNNTRENLRGLSVRENRKPFWRINRMRRALKKSIQKK